MSQALHERLQEAVRQHPNDPEAWAVLTDYLVGKGDPRGMLATVAEGDLPSLLQMTLPEWFSRPVTVQGNRATFRRDLSDTFSPAVTLCFARGHVERLEIQTRWDGGRSEWGQDWMYPLLTAILSHRVGRCVTEFEVRATPNSEFFYEGLVEAIVAASTQTGLPLAVRKLYAGDNDQLSWTNVPDCSALWAVSPWLEHAMLEGSHIQLGAGFGHDRLRVLQLVSGGLPREPIQRLAVAQLDMLEHLEVWFGDPEYGAECAVEDVEPLLSRPFPALRNLALKNAEFGDGLCERIGQLVCLPQLESLDFAGSILTDEGATHLLRHFEALRHLKRLDVSECFLGEGQVNALTQAFGDVVSTAHQRDADDDDGELHYYVALGE